MSDTGTGIPADDLPKVFERFHRVEGSRGRSFEGTGIGLALVSELVKAHGGTVRVESVVGRGSTFVVSLPFGSDHLPKERVALSRTSKTGPLEHLPRRGRDRFPAPVAGPGVGDGGGHRRRVAASPEPAR